MEVGVLELKGSRVGCGWTTDAFSLCKGDTEEERVVAPFSVNFLLPLRVDFSKQIWGNILKNLQLPHQNNWWTKESLSLFLGF